MKTLIFCLFITGSLAAQSWPAFQTTFGSFWQQPRTRGEAEANNWILLSPCSDKFLGHRYAHPNDDSIILIYDDAGFIAGSQSVVPMELVDPDIMDMSVAPAYQMDAWFDIPVYLTTMYFVDPEIICNGGRSQEQFDSQGTGDRLVIQVGAEATADNLVALPLSKTEALADPLWFDHFCFVGMGDHFFQFDYTPEQDCQTVLPLQLLYDDNYGGISNGFVWQHMVNLQGDRWEHPDSLAISMIVDRPPTCVQEAVEASGLSTMHHYFWDYPLLILCPLEYERSLHGYKKLMASNIRK